MTAKTNKEKNIMLAFGTRPEAVKMCPLVNELKSRGIGVTVCLTGQHRELLLPVLEKFGVSADINLDVMSTSQSLSQLTARVLEGISNLTETQKPSAVMVHGDTATAFAVALACFYMKIPVYHVEAGLRTGDIHAPFPEEFNRRVISLIARLHFAPTERAAENLMNEGIPRSRIFVTGNTVLDALKYTLDSSYTHPFLEKHRGKRIIFLTAHRRESHGKRLEKILAAVRRIAEVYTDICIIYPVHPNPAVKDTVYGILSDCERIELCAPLGIYDCHNILSRSYLVLTDSGGIQEEAAALGIPTLVLRNVTERQEGILCGAAMLAGTDTEQIYATVSRVLNDSTLYQAMTAAKNPYGDGNACVRIANAVSYSYFGRQKIKQITKNGKSKRD